MGLCPLSSGPALRARPAAGSAARDAPSTQSRASEREKTLLFVARHPMKASNFLLLFVVLSQPGLCRHQLQELEQLGSHGREQHCGSQTCSSFLYGLFLFSTCFYFFITQIFANTNPRVTGGCREQGQRQQLRWVSEFITRLTKPGLRSAGERGQSWREDGGRDGAEGSSGTAASAVMLGVQKASAVPAGGAGPGEPPGRSRFKAAL